MSSRRLSELVAALFMVSAPVWARDCKDLLENAPALYEKGEINEELAALVLPFQVENGGCASRTEIEDEPYCRATTIPHPSDRPTAIGDGTWNGVDFLELILQIFLNNHNYFACRDIFETDPLLQDLLSNVEVISPTRLAESNRFAGPRLYFGVPVKEPDRRPYTVTQQKMFSIFDEMPDWAYCSGNRYLDGSPPIRAYAEFDPVTKRVSMFNGACAPRDLYGLEVSFVPSFYAGLFVSAHEAGHAIENITHDEWRGHARSEAKATYLGTLMAECVTRLSDGLFTEVSKAADAYERGDRSITGDTALTPTDIEYAQCAVRHLTGWSRYFRAVRDKINLETGELPDDLRAVMLETAPAK